MTDHPEYAALLRDVLTDPADDRSRLILADWLEDHGEGVRAEFIRCQVEWSALDSQAVMQTGDGPCFETPEQARRHECLLKRERDLLLDHGKEWVRPVAALFGCDAWLADHGHSGCQNGPRWGWIRGFVGEVSLPLAAFTEEVARRLFELHPVTRVTLTDRKPRRSTSQESRFYWWNREAGPTRDDPDDLPVELFLLLSKHDDPAQVRSHEEFVGYGTIEEALADLSRSAVTWGRQLANLPPLTEAPK